MRSNLAEIDARVAALDKIQAQEHATQQRILEVEARALAKFEERHLPEQEVQRFVEEVGTTLQLNPAELEASVQTQRAAQLLNPYVLIQAMHCSFHAVSWGSWHFNAPNASCSCTAVLANNELNPRATAGPLGPGLKWALLNSWLWFEPVPYPDPGMVHIKTFVSLHGFYQLLGQSGLNVRLDATGWQYGLQWGATSMPILNLAGNALGRYDRDNIFLDFDMPIGGVDPFQVQVMLKIQATSNAPGAVAIADFATGAGNYMKVHWVNPSRP